MNADRRVFNQAVRNLNDGVSLLNIADGSLEQLSNIITRTTELATQGANGIFSDKQREALDAEAQALTAEYGRILATTSFNGINPLQSSVQIQGTPSSSLAPRSVGLSDTSDLALFTSATSQTVNSSALSFDGANDTATLNINLNNYTEVTISYWARLNALPGVRYQPVSNDAGNYGRVITIDPGDYQLFNSTSLAGQYNTTPVTGQWQLLTATWSTSNSSLYLNGTRVINAAGETGPYNDGTTITLGAGLGSNFYNGSLDGLRIYGRALTSGEVSDLYNHDPVSDEDLIADFRFNEGSGAVARDVSGNGHVMTLNGPGWTTNTAYSQEDLYPSNISLLTADRARNTLDLANSKLAVITNHRSLLGAQTARLNTEIQNLMVTSENYAAAESRIRDTDIAADSSALIRTQILQQVAAAVLAQANVQPQLALRLLQ